MSGIQAIRNFTRTLLGLNPTSVPPIASKSPTHIVLRQERDYLFPGQLLAKLHPVPDIPGFSGQVVVCRWFQIKSDANGALYEDPMPVMVIPHNLDKAIMLVKEKLHLL